VRDIPAERSVNDRVADYYERNTGRWIRSRRGKKDRESSASYTFHRKLWGPGVSDGEQALLHVHTIVSDTLAACLPEAEHPTAREEYSDEARDTALSIVDLGCGAGSTALALSTRFDARVTGVTVSALQADIARRRAGRLGLSERCAFVTGDFHEPPYLGVFHGAIAIESFAHSRRPARFFASASSLLLPGGVLLICDDFLAGPPGNTRARRRRERWIRRFERGWRLGALLSLEEAIRLAGDAGLVLESTRDLSSLVKTRPLLLVMDALLGLLPGWTPLGGNLSGGSACRRCIASGFTRYRLLVFRKPRQKRGE
jgi:SAM-dependent methyltransferase